MFLQLVQHITIVELQIVILGIIKYLALLTQLIHVNNVQPSLTVHLIVRILHVLEIMIVLQLWTAMVDIIKYLGK